MSSLLQHNTTDNRATLAAHKLDLPRDTAAPPWDMVALRAPEDMAEATRVPTLNGTKTRDKTSTTVSAAINRSHRGMKCERDRKL